MPHPLLHAGVVQVLLLRLLQWQPGPLLHEVLLVQGREVPTTLVQGVLGMLRHIPRAVLLLVLLVQVLLLRERRWPRPAVRVPTTLCLLLWWWRGRRLALV